MHFSLRNDIQDCKQNIQTSWTDMHFTSHYIKLFPKALICICLNNQRAIATGSSANNQDYEIQQLVILPMT